MPRFDKLAKILDLNDADRLARAEKLGFDPTKTWYHGTQREFSEFKPEFKGKSTRGIDTPSGYFFSEDPNIADYFANYAQDERRNKILHNLVDAEVKAEDLNYDLYKKFTEKNPNPTDLEYKEWSEKTLTPALKSVDDKIQTLKTQLQKYDQSLKESGLSPSGVQISDPVESVTKRIAGANIIPAHLRMKNPKIVEKSTANMREMKELSEEAKQQGYDGIIFKDQFGEGKSTAIAFEPKQIRSKFAQFDPSQSETGQLSSFAPTDLSKQNPLEIIDKITGRPLRSAAQALLTGQDPIEAVKQGEDVSGERVAKSFLEKIEKAGMPLRAPGQEEFPLEKPLGFVAESVLDPTTIMPIGSFKKIRKLIGK